MNTFLKHAVNTRFEVDKIAFDNLQEELKRSKEEITKLQKQMRIKIRNENFVSSHKNGSASKPKQLVNMTPTQMVANSSKSLAMVNKVANELQAQVERRNCYIDELMSKINFLEE